MHDVLESDDTRVMLEALRQLGCGIVQEGTSARSPASTEGSQRARRNFPRQRRHGDAPAHRGVGAAVGGAGRQLRARRRSTHARAADPATSSARCAASAASSTNWHAGLPPLRVRGGQLDLDAPIRVRGDVSSQFLTALLLALPLVAQDRPVVVEVEGELISKPYVEITLNLLRRFGVEVAREGWQRFTIAPQPGGYRSPGTIHVEGDASSASYFIAAGALAATEGRALRIEGVDAQSIQGDIRFAEAATAMGAQVAMGGLARGAPKGAGRSPRSSWIATTSRTRR